MFLFTKISNLPKRRKDTHMLRFTNGYHFSVLVHTHFYNIFKLKKQVVDFVTLTAKYFRNYPLMNKDIVLHNPKPRIIPQSFTLVQCCDIFVPFSIFFFCANHSLHIIFVFDQGDSPGSHTDLPGSSHLCGCFQVRSVPRLLVSVKMSVTFHL